MRASAAQKFSREMLLADAKTQAPKTLPVPENAVALPDDWDQSAGRISIHLSQTPRGELSIRRVSHNDGRLYLEIRSAGSAISGDAEVIDGRRSLSNGPVKGSIWLSLKPKIGKITIPVFVVDAKEPVTLSSPTTLVEVRGRRIYLNGEPFLLKGATGSVSTQADADYVHSLGLNTFRGLNSIPSCEQFGFMSIASLNMPPAMKELVQASDAEFEPTIGESLEWLKTNSVAAIASPNTLILQLGNEKTGGLPIPPGEQPLSRARRHVSQLLAAARNQAKELAPMLPVGYANQDLGFLAPDCMDVYMHNSFLNKDRYTYPWEDFLRWQGCLPPDGKDGQGRPFVNSEFGANRYLPQAYHGGPNNPVLEKIHAWNFPNRWAEFMESGTVGGSIYCLHDLDKPRDQGCSCFGILTADGKPKLACWDIAHMWRDFDVSASGDELGISLKRDYAARDCRLTLSGVDGKSVIRPLNDFAPHAKATVKLNELLPGGASGGFRWTIDFSTHGGLPNKAAGAWPGELEQKDFLDRLKGRETYPFLSELFDAEVLTIAGTPAPRTLAEMTDDKGIARVALRKRNGVTYLLLIARDDPNKNGPLREVASVDVAFSGHVVKVNDMSGQPLEDHVETEKIDGGLRLNNVLAARIPGAIGQRAEKAFMVPVYRITP